jgi:hypothetical protein
MGFFDKAPGTDNNAARDAASREALLTAGDKGFKIENETGRVMSDEEAAGELKKNLEEGADWREQH